MPQIGKYSVKIRSVTRIQREKEDSQENFVKIVAKDEVNDTTFNMSLPSSDGLKSGRTIQVLLIDEQTTLKAAFNPPKKADKKEVSKKAEEKK